MFFQHFGLPSIDFSAIKSLKIVIFSILPIQRIVSLVKKMSFDYSMNTKFGKKYHLINFIFSKKSIQRIVIR